MTLIIITNFIKFYKKSLIKATLNFIFSEYIKTICLFVFTFFLMFFNKKLTQFGIKNINDLS